MNFDLNLSNFHLIFFRFLQEVYTVFPKYATIVLLTPYYSLFNLWLTKPNNSAIFGAINLATPIIECGFILYSE